MRFIGSLTRLFTYSSLRMIPDNNVAVFGSMGGTGSAVVDIALSNNKNVISLVKNKHNVTNSQNHFYITGDVTNIEDVKKVYKNNKISGTIVCLGGNTADVGVNMLTNGTYNIIKCIKEHNASKKISIVTSIGTGDSKDDPPLFFKILMNTFLKDAFIDKNNQEKLFLEGIGNDLEYIIVRPSGLTNKDNIDEKIKVISSGGGSICRKNVAEFCYNSIYNNSIEFNRKNFIQKCVSITGIPI